MKKDGWEERKQLSCDLGVFFIRGALRVQTLVHLCVCKVKRC